METSRSDVFAKVHGSPGTRVRVAGVLRLFWPLALGLFIAGYLVRSGLPRPDISPVAAGLGLLGLAAILVWVQGRALERFGNYLKGARGEELVSRELALLPGPFEVFHGLPRPSGSGDFDHVVVGSGGVAVVETKHWSGAVTYRDGELFVGRRRPTRSPIGQVRRETVQLQALLPGSGMQPGDVRAVICFAGNTFEADVLEVDGLTVCNIRSLCAVLLRMLDHSAQSGYDREETVAALRALTVD